MEIYLVGGAIRDELLGLPVKERDWVVVGATPEAMIALGFQPVGKDFPVFLHPDTHEEYALARTERKIAKGYKGFEFYTAPNVSLTDDLARRDLTINAIAKSQDGTLIDPFSGQQDLKNKVLKHVSTAFAEDPVRILRAARFAAKLPDFTLHPETKILMHTMATNGEVDALVPERVWQEWRRALNENQPQRFFELLHDCGALPHLFPEIDMAGAGMTALIRSAQRQLPDTVRFAVLLHTLSAEQIQALCRRYRVPRDYSSLALLTCNWLASYQNSMQCSAKQILTLLKAVDALRRQQRFVLFLHACETITADADAISQRLLTIKDALNAIDIRPLLKQNLENRDFAAALQQLQLQTIATFCH